MAPISQSILASMPEEIEPEEEGARPFLDLDKLRSDANRVVQVRRTVAKIQQKKQGATEDVAAELSATDLSSRQLRLKELAGALPRFDALIAAKIPQAPLIDPTLLRQISQVVPTIADGLHLALKSLGTAVLPAPLIDPTLLRQISQVVPTIADGLHLALKSLGTAVSASGRASLKVSTTGVMYPADGPFVVLLSQDGANEAAHGRPVREDAHHYRCVAGSPC